MKESAAPVDGAPLGAFHDQDVTLPAVTAVVHVIGAPVRSVPGRQSRSNTGGGTSETDTLPESVAQPPPLQASRRIVFGPEMLYLVTSVELVPEAGDPPEANHVRRSTVPVTFALHVTS